MQKTIYSQVHKNLLKECLAGKYPEPMDDEFLLYLYLTYTRRHADNRALAKRMLTETGSLFNLIHLPPYVLVQTFGITDIVAVGISNLGTIADRIRQKTTHKQVLHTMEEFYHHLKPYFLTGNYEITAIVCFNKRLQYLDTETITVFDPTQTVATTSLLLDVAHKNYSHTIALAHNHPNSSIYDLFPSSTDILMTNLLKCALAINDITLVDHFVMAYDGCISLLHPFQMPYLDSDYYEFGYSSVDAVDYLKYL